MLDYGTTPGHSNASRWADDSMFDAPASYSWFIRYRWRALFEPTARIVWAKGAMTTSNSGWGFEAINRVPFAGDQYNMRHIDGSDNNFAGIKFLVGVGQDEDHSCGATWDGSVLQIYHDGVALGPPQALTQTIGVNSDQLTLGNRSTLGNGAPVAVGQWLIYIGHVLTESEMAQLHFGNVIVRQDKLSWWVPGTVNPPVDLISGVAATNSGTVSLLGVAAADDLFRGDLLTPMHREVISRELRRNRYANPVYSVRVGPEAAIDELADPINMAHFGYPRAASLVSNREDDQMVRSGQAVFGFLTGTAFDPNEYAFDQKIEDFEHAITTFWSTLTLPFAVDENYDGLAQIGVGVEQKNFIRGTFAWIEQADGMIATLQPNMEKMNHLGYLAEGIHTSFFLNSAFALGLTTEWTDNSGDGSGAEVTSDSPFKGTDMFPRVLEITKGSGATYWTQARSGSVLDGPGNVGHLHILYKDITGRTSFRFSRSADGFFFNNSTGAYQMASVWNLLTDSVGDWTHFISKDLLLTSAVQTYTLDVGVETGSSGTVVRIADAEVQRQQRTQPSTLLPTFDSKVRAEQDELSFSVTNDASKQLVYAERYTIRFSWEAHFFDQEDLFWLNYGDGSANYIHIFVGPPGGGEEEHAICHRVRAANFERTAYLLLSDFPGGSPAEGQVIEIAARLTDSSGYELGLPPRTVSVFGDGKIGLSFKHPGTLPTNEGDTQFWVGGIDPVYSALGEGGFPAWGPIKNLNIQQRAIPDEEILALR